MTQLFTLYESDLVGTNSALYIISLIAILFAIYTIISKNPILSVLFLIGLFCSISVYLMSIGLQFIGLVYLIVYVGAISILFLFILMLINIRVSELLLDNRNNVSLAILTILCFNYSLNDLLPYGAYSNKIFDIYGIQLLKSIVSNIISVQPSISSQDSLILMSITFSYLNINYLASKSWDGIMITLSHIASIGNILYTNLFVHFIIMSLILLLAMVGAIIITVSKSKTENKSSLTELNKSHVFATTPLQSNVLPNVIYSIDIYKIICIPWFYLVISVFLIFIFAIGIVYCEPNREELIKKDKRESACAEAGWSLGRNRVCPPHVGNCSRVAPPNAGAYSPMVCHSLGCSASTRTQPLYQCHYCPNYFCFPCLRDRNYLELRKP